MCLFVLLSNFKHINQSKIIKISSRYYITELIKKSLEESIYKVYYIISFITITKEILIKNVY